MPTFLIVAGLALLAFAIAGERPIGGKQDYSQGDSNSMSGETKEEKKAKNLWQDPRIWVAIITAIGAIVVALIREPPIPTPTLTPTSTPTPEQVIKNSDFSSASFYGWSRYSWVYGTPEPQTKLIRDDDPTYGRVLEFIRTGAVGGMEDGYIAVYQTFPGPMRVTRIEVDVKVISHTLRNPGNRSCRQGGEFTYPVHIYLFRLDTPAWSHGFLNENNGEAECMADNYTEVKEDGWYHYDFSPDDLGGITQIRLAGEGHNFEVRVDNVKVWGYREQ